MPEYSMVTTTDTDIHLIESSADTTRMKCERVKWLTTVDGRFVNTANVVSIWTPEADEVRSYLRNINEG